MKHGLALAIAASSLVVAGCGASDTASFMIDGSDTAVTVERVKAFAWSDGWELHLTVRRNPDCQRRHALKPTPGENPKVELFTPEPYVFIVRQGKRWYVTELKTCALQSFKEAPPEPGTPVGTFLVKGDRFAFVPDAQSKADAPVQPPAEAAQ